MCSQWRIRTTRATSLSRVPSWRNRDLNPTSVLQSRQGDAERADAQQAAEAPEVTLAGKRHQDPSEQVEETVVTKGIYVDGRKVEASGRIHDLRHRLGDIHHGMAWIGLYRPTTDQIEQVGRTFNLHPLAIEDAVVAHQRPKIERYDDTLFVVLRSATYDDASETVTTGEVHLFLGKDFVLTMRHNDKPDLRAVRRRLENDPDLLRHGPEAVLYGVLDYVVDGYAPVVAGLQNDIDEIETEVFGGDPNVSRRIYELSREVVELQRSTGPLLDILRGLEAGFEKYHTDAELQRRFRDVADHATAVAERIDGFRSGLTDILQLNLSLVGQAQNDEMAKLAKTTFEQGEQMKRASSWAAILFAPTIISGIYGMNFDRMPELHWADGYLFGLALMVLVSVAIYFGFKKSGWL